MGIELNEIPRSVLVKYFNQRLLNYKQKFAADSDYIFYALSVMLQLNLNSQINIAMKKVCTNQLTAGMLSNNFSDTVKSFIAKDEGFNFMNSVRGRIHTQVATENVQWTFVGGWVNSLDVFTMAK